MPTPKAVRTTLISFIMIPITAIFIALACGPAAPSPQSQDPKPTPEPTDEPTQEPTPTWETMTLLQNGTPVAVEVPPTPLVEPVLRGSLQAAMEKFEATKEAHERSGRSTNSLDDPAITVAIQVDSPEKVDRLVKWLADKPSYVEYEDRTPEHGYSVSTQIRTSVLKELSELDWIDWITFVSPSFPEGGDPSSSNIDLNKAQGITA